MKKSLKHAPSRQRLSIGIFAVGVLVAFWFAGCMSRRFKPPDYEPMVKLMEVTGYCNCGICCSWEYPWYSVFGIFGSPVISEGQNKGKHKVVGQTAWGTHAEYGTVAADASLPFGTILYIPGYGYGRVEDRGGAIKGDKLDLWFSSHSVAKQWGRKKIAVKIWKR